MNVATGLCLSTFDMRFYVVLDECKTGDQKSEWVFDDASRIRHDSSKFYLTCGCTGLLSVRDVSGSRVRKSFLSSAAST